MGFGYLLIGYLVTFVINMTIQSLGFGGVAVFVGSGLMLLGLSELTRYNRAFVWAKWLLIPILVISVYEMLESLNGMLLWSLPIFGASVGAVVDWLTFMLFISFNLAMLYGIRAITQELGILHMTTAAIRNSFFVCLYAVLYLIAHLPIEAITAIGGYLALPVTLTYLIWLICNLTLLLSCNKNICRAGDEEQPAKPSRFGVINRLNEAYESNRQRSIEKTTQETEAFLRRRKEKRERKHKKK